MTEQNKKQSNKKSIISLAILGIVLVAAVVIMVMSKGTKSKEVVEETPTPITIKERSLTLNVGDTQKLTVESGEDLTFKSSAPEVATVDDKGNVTAVAKGNSMITISDGEQTAYCGVLVGLQGTMVDISKQKANVVFSEVPIFHLGEIIGFDYDAQDNAFYFSQRYAIGTYNTMKSDSMFTKVEKKDGSWQRTESMQLYNHGYGYFGLDLTGEDVYLVTEAEGAYLDRGSALAYLRWEDNAMHNLEEGATWHFPDIEGSFSVKIDQANNLVIMRVEEKRQSYYLLYNYDDFKNESEPQYLKKIVCASGQTPANGVDDSQGRYSATLKGYALHDGYIYQVSGANHIYVSVFDLEGNLQYCHRVMDYPDLEFRRPGGIVFNDGKMYMAVSAGEKELYHANVWVFEGGNR